MIMSQSVMEYKSG